MTIENRDGLGFIDGQNLKGAYIQSLYKATLGNGVLASTVTNTKLKITEDEAAANMTVTAQLGDCIINGTVYTEATDVEDIAVAAAHATNERIDLVIYDQSGSTVAVITGTPHATDPQVPDVTDDDDLLLALIYVKPQDDGGYTGTIVNGDITDLRAFVELMDYCAIALSQNNQAINNSTITDVLFDKEFSDVKNLHSTSSNKERVTAIRKGYYHVFGTVTFDGHATGERRVQVRVYDDSESNDTPGSGLIIIPGTVSASHAIPFATTIYMDVDDYTHLHVYQDRGGTLNIEGSINNSETTMGVLLIREII